MSRPTDYEQARDELLSVLRRNGGALLSWQAPMLLRPYLSQAIGLGDVLHNEAEDLLVHPEAVRIGEGAYTMPADDRSGELFGKG